MDLLYSRYSNPLEFMRLYIDQGRFGEFVSNIIDAENKRLKEKYEKENEDKLWQMYIHSYSDKSFIEWKNEMMNGQPQNQEPSHKSGYSLSMTDEEVENQLEKSRSILKGMKMH